MQFALEGQKDRVLGMRPRPGNCLSVQVQAISLQVTGRPSVSHQTGYKCGEEIFQDPANSKIPNYQLFLHQLTKSLNLQQSTRTRVGETTGVNPVSIGYAVRTMSQLASHSPHLAGVPARHTHAKSSVHRPPHVSYVLDCTDHAVASSWS